MTAVYLSIFCNLFRPLSKYSTCQMCTRCSWPEWNFCPPTVTARRSPAMPKRRCCPSRSTTKCAYTAWSRDVSDVSAFVSQIRWLLPNCVSPGFRYDLLTTGRIHHSARSIYHVLPVLTARRLRYSIGNSRSCPNRPQLSSFTILHIVYANCCSASGSMQLYIYICPKSSIGVTCYR